MIESVSVTIQNTPEIHVAATVIAGAPGKDAYQSYLQTTDDDPPLTEEEWSAGGGGGGTVDAAALASITHAATAKDTPVDNDEVGLADSAATYGWKKLKWSAIKATLKAYFDTIYQTTAVTWSTLAGKPATFPPTIGTGATDAVAGNDSRLTDSRNPTAHNHAWSEITSGVPSSFTPTAHKSTHATGGADALSPSDIGAIPATSGTMTDGTIGGTFTFNSTTIAFGTGAAAALRYAMVTAPRDEASDVTLALTDYGVTIRLTKASGSSAIGVPQISSVAFPVGFYVMFRRAGAGTLTLNPSGVTINGNIISSIAVNGEFALRHLGSNVWDFV